MAGKWKHGWIPEDATATALKMHRSTGGKSAKAPGPPKVRKPAAPAMPASERQGLRGVKAAPKPKTPPKVKNPGGRNMQDLSVPKDIAKVKSKPAKRAGVLTSSAIRRGKG